MPVLDGKAGIEINSGRSAECIGITKIAGDIQKGLAIDRLPFPYRPFIAEPGIKDSDPGNSCYFSCGSFLRKGLLGSKNKQVKAG
jgi:hypothetical protein